MFRAKNSKNRACDTRKRGTVFAVNIILHDCALRGVFACHVQHS